MKNKDRVAKGKPETPLQERELEMHGAGEEKKVYGCIEEFLGGIHEMMGYIDIYVGESGIALY